MGQQLLELAQEECRKSSIEDRKIVFIPSFGSELRSTAAKAQPVDHSEKLTPVPGV